LIERPFISSGDALDPLFLHFMNREAHRFLGVVSAIKMFDGLICTVSDGRPAMLV
jgi:hypothetical protein